MGGFSAGSSLFGALGASQQAKARNRAAQQNYEHMLKVRKHEWYQQLSIWGAQRNKYYIDLNENDLAAQRGYSQAQVALNSEFAAAAQKNEGALIKYLQSSGKLAAMGRTGRSISRIGSLDLGALERASSRNYWKLTRSKETYKATVDNIRNAQLSNRNQLSANVAFAPVPDLAPPPPIYEKEGLGVLDIASAAFSGLSAYSKAGGKFGGFKSDPGAALKQELGRAGNQSWSPGSSYQPAWSPGTNLYANPSPASTSFFDEKLFNQSLGQ